MDALGTADTDDTLSRPTEHVVEEAGVGATDAASAAEDYGSTAWLRARVLLRPSVGITSVELLNLIYEDEL